MGENSKWNSYTHMHAQRWKLKDMKEMGDLYKVGEKHSNNWQVTEIFEGTNETFEHRRYQTGKYFWFRLYESDLFP